MEVTYPELEEFKEVSSRMDKQLYKLRKMKQEREVELVEVERKYQQMMDDEATLGNFLDKVQFNHLSKKKESLAMDIKQYEDRIIVIESKQKEVLAEYLPALHEGYKKEVKNLNNQIQDKMAGIIPAALPYLSYLADIGALNRKRSTLFDVFISEAKKVDKDFENKHYKFSIGDRVDARLFDDAYSGNQWGYGLSVDEQKAAIGTGGLPYRHALYKITGEIEPRYFEAKKKSEEALYLSKVRQVDSNLDKKLQKLQKEINELEVQRGIVQRELNHEKYAELDKAISKLKAERRKLKEGK